jgi:hypothetical protein
MQSSKNDASCSVEDQNRTRWSIDRQVRIASGLLVLVGISLAYSICLPFIWLAILVALGMVLSGITNSCALGLLIKQLPWNHPDI